MEGKASLQKTLSLLSEFWQKHPAFYLSLSACLSLAMADTFTFAYFLPLCLLFYPYKIRKSLKIACFVGFLFFFFYGGKQDTPSQASSGKGHFVLDSVKENTSFFQQKFLLYKGKLTRFQTGEKIYKNIPCSIRVKPENDPFGSGCDYFVEGTLKKNRSGKYSFKISSSQEIKGSFSLAKWRFTLKQKIKTHLDQNLHKESSSLLKALLLGDLDSKSLSFFFQKLGLSHILAISGFHFTLLASFYGFILHLLMPRKIASIILLFLIAGYAFLIGPSPSVMRAWMMISMYLLFQMLHRSHLSLNAMGASLLILLLFDPSSIHDLGLQLSFLCTFAILTLYSPIDKFLLHLPKQETKKGFLQKPRRYAETFLRKNFSVCFAATIFSLPVVLFIFKKFPLLSLFYNLFIPSFAALSFFFLLLGLSLAFFPFLAKKIYFLADTFTKCWLDLLYNSPPFLDRYLYVDHLPFSFVIAALTALCFLGMVVYQKKRTRLI